VVLSTSSELQSIRASEWWRISALIAREKAMSYRVCVVHGCVRLSSRISECTASYLVWRATSAQQVTRSACQPASIATARRRLSSKRRIYSGRARTEKENGRKTSQNSSRILFICNRPRCALNDNIVALSVYQRRAAAASQWMQGSKKQHATPRKKTGTREAQDKYTKTSNKQDFSQKAALNTAKSGA